MQDCNHEEEHACAAQRAKDNMPAEEKIISLATAFKAISDNAGEKSIREYSENLQIALAALGEKLLDIFAEVNNG